MRRAKTGEGGALRYSLVAGELRKKCPEKRERVERIVDAPAAELQQLRAFTPTDHLFTLYSASKEFAELEELVPDEKTVADLLREEE